MDSLNSMLWLAVIGVVGVLVAAIIKVLNRRGRTPLPAPRLDQMSQQLEALQQAADATALEVERLGESVRFTVKILTERSHVRERRGDDPGN